MTECTHFAMESDKETIEKLINILGQFTVNITNQNYTYNCMECSSPSYLHVCLTCFMIFCFKNKHYKKHHEKTNHKFMYCLEKKLLFCFICKKYVNEKSLSNLCNYVFVVNDECVTNNAHIKDNYNKNKLNYANYYIDNILKISCKVNHVPVNTKYLLNPEDSLTAQINEKTYKRVPCTIQKGATNLGNTCYINSLIQILLSITIFKQKVLQTEHKNCSNCLICIFREIVEDLYSQSTSLVFSNFFYYLYKKDSCFKGSVQYDVHELFIKICNYLHGEVGDSLCKTNKCLAHDMFYGENIVNMECCVCKKVTRSNDDFFNLIFEMKQKSIQTMINEYYKSEEIEEKKFCNNCQTMTRYTKNIVLESKPEVLVISVKRFEIKNSKASKISDFIYNNLSIDLNNNVYKLQGYIKHIGNMRDGHYVSVINNNNKFYTYDDDKIEEETGYYESIENESYLIFYVEN
ncbi:Ubiquitin carboxyl-terminal hydrolase 51 [Binucleata daphniae]